MTKLTQISHTYFVDREGANLQLSPESLSLNQPVVRRDSRPFSLISEGKFRRVFNRHSFTRMR